ncbi:MAG TPA: nuclear transport factor 2 family protein [Chitinophagaceae bacterium]|jgi:predicted SnoaL-like aldol condensation-catalyzing enzyme|nr:nuclear transport factor 2 family protein [Chitinophagaceae bacterium]
MKKFLNTTALALLCLLTACSDNKSENSTENNSAGTTKSAAAEGKGYGANRMVYDAVGTNNLNKLDSIMDENIIDHAGPGGTELKGRSNVKAYLATIPQRFTDLKWDIVAEASDGDYEFTMVHRTNTTKDNSMGMPAGTRNEETVVDVTKMSNGKIVEHWYFAKPEEIMKRMGAGSRGMSNRNGSDSSMKQ